MPEDRPARSRHYLEAELAEQIRTNPAMWDFIRKSSLDGVWYWDLEDPEQEWMSPEFWQLFGIDPATRRHRASEWQDLIHPADLEKAMQNFRDHCAEPDHPYDQVVRYRHADGSTVWVRCRGLAIRDDTGRPVRMLGAHTAITDVKEARAESAALAAANAELKTVAYALSHDLKSPVHTLCMLVSEFARSQEGGLDGDGRMLLGLMQTTAEKMSRLVDDLLVYSVVLGDDPTREPVPLDDLLRAVVEAYSTGQAGREVSFLVEPLPVVLGNPEQLRMMAEALISNAMKFRAPDRRCEIRITADDDPASDMVTLHVADNGIGMDADSLSRIFRMFGRLHRAEDIPGNGLGLALVRRIAVLHGGDVSVQSVKGDGSVFSVTLSRRAS